MDHAPKSSPRHTRRTFHDVEGVLDQVYEELTETVFSMGDSGVAYVDDRAEFQEISRRFKQVQIAELPFTLVLNDPLARS